MTASRAVTLSRKGATAADGALRTGAAGAVRRLAVPMRSARAWHVARGRGFAVFRTTRASLRSNGADAGGGVGPRGVGVGPAAGRAAPKSSLEARLNKQLDSIMEEQAKVAPPAEGSFRPFAAMYLLMGLAFGGGFAYVNGYIPGVNEGGIWQEDCDVIPLYKGNPVVFMDVSIAGSAPERIVVQLRSDLTPRTAENFLRLCTGDNPKGLSFEGSRFHRIIEGHLVQGGDVTRHDGYGSESVFGGAFEDENHHLLHSGEGILAMANAGKPNTNGSQFFITLDKLGYCDGKYVVFGNVVSGMETVRRIGKLGTPSGAASTEVVVSRCGQLALADDVEGPPAAPKARD